MSWSKIRKKTRFLVLKRFPKKLTVIEKDEKLAKILKDSFGLKINVIHDDVLNIDENKLNLEGIISYVIKTKMPVKDLNYNLIDIKKESELSQDFILVDNPMQYFSKDSIHPYQKLIASLIQKSTTSDYSKLFKIILENSKGNMIWINDKDWLTLTRKSDTNKTEISNILKILKSTNHR